MYNGNDKNLQKVKNEALCRLIEINKSDVKAIPELNVPGDHMKFNAATAVAAAEKIGINVEPAIMSLSKFNGTWRRFQVLGKYNSNLLISDYAHHPTEVKATLQSFDEAVTPVLYDLTVNPSPCCGDLKHPYPVSDNNKDCKVNFIDLSIAANEWLDCTSPLCN